MKKIYYLLLKSANGILAGLMLLLGFSSCQDQTVEYGAPSADYAIKGTVVNKSTGQPVQGIEVKIDIDKPYVQWKGPWEKLTTQEGLFNLSMPNALFDGSEQITIAATDIDGEANGSFKSDTVYVSFRNAQQTAEGKRWFMGEFTLTVKVELNSDEPDK
jgi:putative lipoprotein (rSAM/lipoprotein system)